MGEARYRRQNGMERSMMPNQPNQIGLQINVEATLAQLKAQIGLWEMLMEAKKNQVAAEIGLLQIQVQNAKSKVANLEVAKEHGAGSPIVRPPSGY